MVLKLMQLLLEAGRTEGVKCVTEDEEYRRSLYREFQLKM